MKWKYAEPRAKDYSQWHNYFLWWPVKISGYKYWLCTVQRRLAHVPMRDSVRRQSTWEYREVEFRD